MYTEEQLAEYMDAIRKEVCTHCIERPPGGPPCGPLGKRCGIEVNLRQIVDSVHAKYSPTMESYTANFHEMVCTHCANRQTDQCPCPMEYLLILAVQAIESVDESKGLLQR